MRLTFTVRLCLWLARRSRDRIWQAVESRNALLELGVPAPRVYRLTDEQSIVALNTIERTR